MVALATAYNARETEGGITKQELLHFVEEVSWVCAHVYKLIILLNFIMPILLCKPSLIRCLVAIYFFAVIR